jgi:uncharacterized protein (DUF1810 family)
MSGPTEDGLERFLIAQARDYEQALAELKAGQKRSHWIWYVLPQLRGLGRSDMARYYGIRDRSEAEAYIAHPVLGQRLVECVEAVLTHPDRSAVEIFGVVDAVKFRSCLTLFGEVAEDEDCFAEAMRVFYVDERDAETLRLLASEAS